MSPQGLPHARSSRPSFRGIAAPRDNFKSYKCTCAGHERPRGCSQLSPGLSPEPWLPGMGRPMAPERGPRASTQQGCCFCRKEGSSAGGLRQSHAPEEPQCHPESTRTSGPSYLELPQGHLEPPSHAFITRLTGPKCWSLRQF